MKNIFKNGPNVANVGIFGNENGSGSITFEWEGSKGFGLLSLNIDKDNKVFIDTECMGPQFARSVFEYLLNNAKFDTDIEPYEVIVSLWVPNQEIKQMLNKANVKEGSLMIKSNTQYLNLISSLEDVGLNIMLTKNKDGVKTLFVDNRRFTQK